MMKVIRFVRVALAARLIQDYLWNRPGRRIIADHVAADWSDWERQLRYRLAKIHQIRRDNPKWHIEAKKRLLQVATMAVAMMEAIDHAAIEPPALSELPVGPAPDNPSYARTHHQTVEDRA